ncbi:hypothetical protein A2V61_01370 [Candidatus Woesebacteria bacterium RBG_19FT_COMBO_47_8]|uniref:Uncharacterized protein n=1 Tax=Candidatus Woesebacteria bacterium RBG_13_46_13 TaxID=1802479 RepID=A0A1F7X3Y1_9BACT|nr:MAG: hypothetical protein A2Y68_03800 [Candidatus Woesebacteria bacterium RBG_13_46_13]OGM18201.1 MAG: hypothetical protein A2V61_01370 [Candidatus Woesebacteria bacterium RBG_19FT_COMBO_47_8]
METKQQRVGRAFSVLAIIVMFGLVVGLSWSDLGEKTSTFSVWIPAPEPPEETARLLARWQSEGGLEWSIEEFLSFTPHPAFVFPMEDEFGREVLTYVGEFGPDYPLMFARGFIRMPFRHYVNYPNHQWNLEPEGPRGANLILHSWGYGFLPWSLAVILICIMLYGWYRIRLWLRSL